MKLTTTIYSLLSKFQSDLNILNHFHLYISLENLD